MSDRHFFSPSELEMIKLVYRNAVKCDDDIWPEFLIYNEKFAADCGTEEEAVERLFYLGAELVGSDEPIIESEQEEDATESIQMEDDEDKEVVDDSNHISEDFHGGNEATKSVKNSPSSADNGENDNANHAQKGKDEKRSTSEEQAEEHESGNTPGGPRKHQVSIDPEKLAGLILNRDEFDQARILTQALQKLCQLVQGKAQGSHVKGWDKRAMVKHYITSQLNRIPADKKRVGCDKITVAIDCSGSTLYYHKIVHSALEYMSRYYEILLVDCSNGFNSGKTSYVGGYDPFNNRKRLEETFCNISRVKMHSTITTPNVEDAAKLAGASELFVVLADYDGYATICQTAQLCEKQGSLQKMFFVDLEDRYEDPDEHNWNYDDNKPSGVWDASDWPVKGQANWWKLFSRGQKEADGYDE